MEDMTTFGKCLEDLLYARGWSSARLARELYIDASYVRKWVRGERVPSLNSDYVAKIVDSMVSGISAPAAEVLVQSCGENTSKVAKLREVVSKRLYEAQLASLKLAPEERKNAERITDFFESIYRRDAQPAVGWKEPHPEYLFMEKTSVIQGRKKILSVVAGMLAVAAQQNVSGRQIYITSYGERDIFDGSEKLCIDCEQALKNALEQGWNVIHLLKLDTNLTRSFRLTERIIRFQGYKGAYTPLYHTRFGASFAPQDFVLVTGVGVLQILNAESDNAVAAFFHSQQEAIATWERHLDRMRLETMPLIEVYTEEEYLNSIVQIDQKLGDRFIAKHTLDIITYPIPFFEEFLRACNPNEQEVEKDMATVSARIQAFFTQVGYYKFLNICPMSVIEKFVRTGEMRDTCNIVYRPDPQALVERLQYLIKLLNEYPNFELALLNETQIRQIVPVPWMLKGDYGVFFYVQKPLDESSLIWLSINEPSLVGAFREYFMELWSQIPPRSRDKSYIVAWLEDQVKWLIKTKCISPSP